MPTVTVQQADMSPEAAIEALSRQLGDKYTIIAGTGTGEVFKVRTSALVETKVHMRKGTAGTEFHVHGVGFLIGRLANELGIARRVAKAIAEAPGLGGGSAAGPA